MTAPNAVTWSFCKEGVILDTLPPKNKKAAERKERNSTGKDTMVTCGDSGSGYQPGFIPLRENAASTHSSVHDNRSSHGHFLNGKQH